MKTMLLPTWFLLAAIACGKGQYTGRHLYAETDAKDTGGIIVKLLPKPPNIRRAVAFARRQQQPYLGNIAPGKNEIRFTNLPIDKYDLLIVTDDTIYEGIELVAENQAPLVATESKAIEKEVRKIEGFFEGKRIGKVRISDELKAVVLVQQWRIGKALAESGAALKGTIHSIDLFWFEKPAKVWQLTKRRQLYREEFERKTPFICRTLSELSAIRVVRKTKTVTVRLPRQSTIPQK